MICPRCNMETNQTHKDRQACIRALQEAYLSERRARLTVEIENENDPKRSKQLTKERDKK